MDTGQRFDASRSDEGRYRLLVEAITDYAIYMLDPRGVVTSWNPGAIRFKGYTAEEIIGQHFSRFYTEEDKETGLPEKALEQARQGSFESEGWRVRKDGTRFWAYVVIDPIKDTSGAIVGFAKITRDLSERRKAEEALRLSEERFKLLVQGVTDYAIYMLDPEGRVTNWNVGAQRIKGYSADEVVGRHFSTFYTQDDQEAGEPAKSLTTAMDEGRFETEALHVRKDGSRFWAHVVIDPIRDDNGSVIGFAKITRDITERRDAQIRLEQAREALVQSQKMDALGRLTGGIAHDFNNLLAIVMGSLELLRKHVAGNEKAQRLMENAMAGARRGASLTQRMLAFARRQDLKTESIGIVPLVEGMAEMLQRPLGPTVSLQTNFPLNLPFVLADPNQLESALLNLVVNSRDAMPDGGTISIAAKEVRKNSPAGDHRQFVVVSVADSGEGMDAETLSRAREPFFTTKGIGKGTGLGLSMVHGLMEQLGGELRLQSAPGKGTVAQLWLPTAAYPASTIREAITGANATSTAAALKVLLVDDDPLVLMGTSAMLEDLGHEVDAVASGAEAIQILQSNDYDLVLTDFAMPKMTGTQLAEAIGTERPSLPVLVMTGYAELPDTSRVTLPRLAKPFAQAELAAAIAEVTSGATP